MKSSMHQEFPRLQGEEAIDSLHQFINELDECNKDLTKNQAKTLKKVAEVLIASIEAELSGEPRIKESGAVN
jgi:hypothetical protein